MVGKQHKTSHGENTQNFITSCLELIHMDLTEPTLDNEEIYESLLDLRHVGKRKALSRKSPIA